ncbi:bifunctional class I SAM-dependent methyltransferase/N-acetyltransferase [Streptomyces sp. 71268]|uniref:bifunctional class I SAM-dependent methyltransferase/N-acetyltransferase n=1 Tax=Streptomyces sp. 71268 TaxID=3002640 RepID=UPI0023FA2AFA|nr:bifunctional class I SAM-dependent methyltransferase/N-acetyltransferase [Streptomyces sp. 71268]WEV26724.1 bifunctional class I SAM-dependent methyltransferase/N-acetyltransferase [Streptomyces sp. 71268]
MADRPDGSDPVTEALFALHRGLPRQGPGSDATTRRLLELAGPLPGPRPRVLDAGCGPGRGALLLAEEAGARVTAVDVHQPFLDELAATAASRGLGERITVLNRSMDRLPFPDHSFDVIWSEGAVYNVGFETALRSWRRLLAPGGVLVVTEIEWTTSNPSAPARAFWDPVYPLRTSAANADAARAAGYWVDAHWPLPESDWWNEYYTPLSERIARADPADPAHPGMGRALAAARAEITLRRHHGSDYDYAGYVLHPDDTAPDAAHGATPEAGTHPGTAPDTTAASMIATATDAHLLTNRKTMTTSWTTRPETAADVDAIREINTAAFPTDLEAGIVDALRADPAAWIDGLSLLAEAPDGTPVAHALLTRCHVDGAPALTLGPCAVLPSAQRTGAGSAAIRAGLDAAHARGEGLVLVLGHPEYYPRFGFTPASRFGIRAPFEVPDEAMMALALDPAHPIPAGTIEYPAAFGV